MDKTTRKRTFQGTALVALLAVSGFSGAYRETGKTVSIPVTAIWRQEEMESVQTMGNDWEKEISLLDQAICEAPEEIAAAAQEKRLALIESMRREKLAQEAIEMMGYDNVGVICGQEAILVFAPHAVFDNEAGRLQMIDGVCMATGVSAAQVKIILTKK